MAQRKVETMQRLKEVMGGSVDDTTILNAMIMNHDDFERSLNYLLEGNFESHQQPHQQQQLRQSITDAFTTTPIKSDSQWPSTTTSGQNPSSYPSNQSQADHSCFSRLESAAFTVSHSVGRTNLMNQTNK